MRGILSKIPGKNLLLVLALATPLTALAQSSMVIDATNQTWKYHPNPTDPGYSPSDAWKESTFDDMSWSSGRGLFGTEAAGVYPYPINTSIPAPGGGGPPSSYFRTHFNFSGNPAGVYLSFTNYIDDGLLVYLNGVELFSFNMVPDRPVLWSVNALPGGANPGGEPVIFRTNLVPSNLIVGDNVLAVELHQQGTGSSDDVFGMWMATLIPYAPTNLALNQPTNRVLLQNRTTTLICVADGFPPPTFQWYMDGVPITDATSSTLTLTNNSTEMSVSNFFCRVSNSEGTFDTRTAMVTFTSDTAAPALVRAVGSASLDKVVVEFNEAMDPNTATDPFAYNIVDNTASPLAVTAVALAPDGASAILTTTAQAENTPYTLTMLLANGVTDLAGNPLPDSMAQFNSWIRTNCPGLLFEAYNGTAGPTVAGQIAGNAVAILTAHPSFPNNPSESTNITAFDSRQAYPDDSHEGYGGRIRGLFIPPYSGQWRLYLRSDDASELWFNPNGPGSGGRTKVAQETGCCNAFLPAGAQQTSLPLSLVAGQAYYIETLWKEGTGGDFAQVAAKIDGDLTDPGTLTPLSADMVGANAVPAGAAGDFTITQQPANTMVVSGGTATFTVGTSTDVPLCYQWQRGGVDIPGAIGPNYSLTAFQPDSGAVFSVRVSILGGKSINSANATLSVGVDNIRPTVVAVAADAYGTNVTVSFSETVDPATSQTAGNYLINNVAASSATRVNGTNVVLVPASPLQACVLQQVRVSGVLDLASNPVNPNPTTVNFTAPILLVSRTATWKYDDSGNDLGTSWSAPAFNDGAWLSGGALLGFEPAAAQIPPVVTPLSGTVTNKTAYFRIHFSLPTHPGAITHLQLIEIVDDGAVYYINNVEARRTRMPTGVITATTLASAGGPEPTDGTHTVEGPTDIPTAGLVEGDNVLAVELHPSSLTSSDAVFAAELIAVVTACGPGLNIAQSGNQAVLTWSDPTYSLQRATAVTGPYTTVAGAVSGFTTPITGNSFFRLTKP